MKEQLETRLKQLQEEFDSGQKMLSDLEVKQSNLRNTLLRISGAIQVLEEQLGHNQSPDNGTDQLESVEESVTQSNREKAKIKP